jgi:ABC-type transporter Mla subunit MlaD
MTDENANTADLTINEKLDRILSRLDALEAKADDRANTTRPLLDQIIKEMVQTRETLSERIDGVERSLAARLDRIEKQLRVMTQDIMQVRTDQQSLEDRMDDLEQRPN